ncbi:MAG: cytochrome c3 family protein [Desulfonauticus sp.]|nr:cytochrome c3 family protein [Desulfonauticus sp.]
MRVRSCFKLFLILAMLIWINAMMSVWGWAQNFNPVGNVKKCLTCHSELKKEFSKKIIHKPFKDLKCTYCHNPHAAKHGHLLKEDVGILCTRCHKNERQTIKMRGYFHPPFKEGQCLKCHNPHASSSSHLLKAQGERLCFACHVKKQFTKKYQHIPVKNGRCLSCHDVHRSEHESLLKREPKILCMSCHSYSYARLQKIHFGYPVQNKDCTSCHNPHSTKRRHLIRPILHKPFEKRQCTTCHKRPQFKTVALKKNSASICFQCHPDKRKDFYKINSHIGSGVFCLNCHDPHASNAKKLEKQNEAKNCFHCHEDSERDFFNKTNKYKHPLVKEGKCSVCHSPHGSNYRLFFEGGDIKMCTRCHKRQARFTHPIGKDAIDPRSKRAISCITCHELMGTPYQFSLRFDRKKDLCIQCHKGY